MHILHYVSFGIGVGGVAVICWGVLVSLVRFMGLEIDNVRGADICSRREMLRHSLGSYLLLGLEFLVAADITKTIVTPTLQQVAILASVVGIRTVLNYFLTREIRSGPCYPGMTTIGKDGAA
ncbi:MAG TPA: DUF1622 domain-containing protein [Anaerohalosphaeraceae bacterium]|nr:DUF1622 domain-containing protein [Anaerohalosphaeraceae bacterium]HRT51064.1 DUF1622 domain-containing protein [Anaerohalosphaeraceae bacterium]HRT87079.1 DUF1622 domain-containing protein [Anaerohalosphaeraceae bacterium]